MKHISMWNNRIRNRYLLHNLCCRRVYEDSDSSISDSTTSLSKKQRSSLLESEEVTDSDSDLHLLKLPTSSQNFLPTQPFMATNLESHESDYQSHSDLDITNAQSCKFGKVVIENSEGGTGNCSTTTSSTPQPVELTKSTPSVQPQITKHFRSEATAASNTDAQPGMPQNQHVDGTQGSQEEAKEHIGTYSLVRSSLALSNL